MNKNEFIEGDPYTYIGTSEPLIYLNESSSKGVGVFKNHLDEFCHYEYCNMIPCTMPEPKYPNSPLPHCEERIAFAKGANIESSRKDRVKWGDDLNPTWSVYIIYRVKVEKTKDELRIEELKRLITGHNLSINIWKTELHELTPTVHY
jgi:hypothetical protein